MKIITLSGIAKWAKVRKPDPDYGNYSLDLYLDDESLAAFKKAGIQLKLKENEDGFYANFKRAHKQYNYAKKVEEEKGPPTVYLLDEQSGEYAKWPEGLIGNGSKVKIAVEVYKSKNGVGTRLERVFVDELVEYDGTVVEPDTVSLPF